MPNAPFLAPERDSAYKPGRAKASGTAQFCVPGVVFASVGTQSTAVNTDRYSPFIVDTPISIDQLACEVTTGVATNFRMGCYAADTDWQPVGAPLADSGDIDITSTGVKTYTPGTPLYLPRGRYLSIWNTGSNGGAMRAFQGASAARSGSVVLAAVGSSPYTTQLAVGRTYAAFATPGSAWTTTLTTTTPGPYHVVLYRVSQP